MSSWRGLSRLRRRASSAAETILRDPCGRSLLILEDDSTIVCEDDDAARFRG
jgi:hypothetical protein